MKPTTVPASSLPTVAKASPIRKKRASQPAKQDSLGSERRRQQNRTAQRNFRARQEQELGDLQGQIVQLQANLNDVNVQLAEQSEELSNLRAENQLLRESLQYKLAIPEVQNISTLINTFATPLAETASAHFANERTQVPVPAHAHYNSPALSTTTSAPYQSRDASSLDPYQTELLVPTATPYTLASYTAPQINATRTQYNQSIPQNPLPPPYEVAHYSNFATLWGGFALMR